MKATKFHDLGRAPTAPGRNDPCPCGSGRKYKQCCAGRPSAAAADGALRRVAELRDVGRFVEAARLAAEYTQRHPQDPAGHAALGTVNLTAGRAADALTCLLRAAQLAPDVAEYHWHAGLALMQLSRSGEAITALRRAVKLDPEHAEALEQLGALLLNHDRQDEALECFRRVAAAEPDSVRGMLNRARLMIEEGLEDEADAVLRQTTRRHPTNVDAKRSLATRLREQGHFEEAIALLEEATEGSPLQAAIAYFELAMSKRVNAADEPMLEQMRALLNFPRLPEIGRRRLHFGLGKALDDLGDYRAAMQQFDLGNQIVRRGQGFDRSHFGASVERLIRSLRT